MCWGWGWITDTRVYIPLSCTCAHTRKSDSGCLQLSQVMCWSSSHLSQSHLSSTLSLDLQRLFNFSSFNTLYQRFSHLMCLHCTLDLCPDNVISVALCHRSTTWAHLSCLSSCCHDTICEHTLPRSSQQECEKTHCLWNAHTHTHTMWMNPACMALA